MNRIRWNGQKWTKKDQIDRSESTGPNWTELIEVD